MNAAGSPTATRDRLLAAATGLFAERGFNGTSIRDIAERAGTNVASGHYHYGSKEGLYLEVLRAQFAEVGALLERRGINLPRAALRRASRRQLRAMVEARILAIAEFLLGPPPKPHGALMLREMCDPTAALPIIVAEFVRPRVQEMEAIVSRLAPRASVETVRLVVFSMLGQVLFYRFSMPAMRLLLGAPAYPRGFARRIARHITTFSLGGLERAAAAHGEKRHAH